MGAKVISIINWKGGVGKTTLTHHLGTGIMHLEPEERVRYFGREDMPRVLLVDSDAQCSLSVACLDVETYERLIYREKRETLNDIYLPYLQNDRWESDVGSCILKWQVRASNRGTYPTVDLLPAHQELIFMDMNIAVYKRASMVGSLMESDVYKFQVLDQILLQVKDDYDFIFIDCPPSLNFLTLNAFYASDYYLIPTLLDLLAIYGLSSIVSRVEEMNGVFLRSADGYTPTKLLGVVANNVREYKQEPKESQATIQQQLFNMVGDQLFQNYVTMGDGIPSANQVGYPVYALSGTNSKAKKQGQEMLAVLTEMLERMEG
ncbi:P-loop containing nucleoside triphosphate hydrolase [Syntrophomonas zehnderi OL-4]|uniref:p-loop containing nucleoside triphosphate hydrolase n=1 Tax=Syntrophomonas zehnderi OL-4 TaxID=690567 RepID=A0A0E4C7S1_9FIRM|nr:AAA family ATPase [Syntrophomonas zehnderi]CFX11794.1 P-loop containing nucleoside triphosphate hydrolase [Syntrophomonas zehnderi OL-4]